MFEVGEIYRFDRDSRYSLNSNVDENRVLSRSVRDFAFPGGSQYPVVLIEERCYAHEPGYYKVLEILGEKPRLDRFGRICCYDMDLKLEKAAPITWASEQDAGEFFQALEERGFYVCTKTCGKRQHESENTQKWFALHAGKGIVAVQSIPVSEHCLKDPKIWFLHPALQSVRRMLYQNIEVAYPTFASYGLGGYSLDTEERDRCPVPLLEADIHSPNWNGHSATLAAFGPDIFRLVERYQMLPDEIISNHRMKFRMPFVDHQKYEGPVFKIVSPFGPTGQEASNPYPQEEYRAYYEQCRKVFLEFPEEVQVFLKKYTDVEERYLQGEPWKSHCQDAFPHP